MQNPTRNPVPESQTPSGQIVLKRRTWVESPELCVMGVDPGLGMTGVAVLKQFRGHKPVVVYLGVVATEKEPKKSRRNLRVTTDDKRRFTEIWGKMSEVANAHAPQALAVEVYSPWQGAYKGKEGGGGFKSAWKTATVYGLCLGFGFARGLLVFPFLPMDIKRGIVGAKGASKEDVFRELLGKVEGLGPCLASIPKSKQEHVTDAAAHAYLGLCEMHIMREELGVKL